MGGIVSTTIKSGTNQFHGDVFEFLRNDALNANTWSNNFTGADRPKLRSGTEFGHPRRKPIQEGQAVLLCGFIKASALTRPTSIGAISVLTPQERSGDFSQLLPKSSRHYNCTAQRSSMASGQLVLHGNLIPSNMLDPVAQKIVSDTSSLSLTDWLGAH